MESDNREDFYTLTESLKDIETKLENEVSPS
ncbi:MAG: hypothetical protein U5K84_11375 [Alkalibacterium sp.]|nr:hypothetical protein [Alkalibacterium sp.]